MKRITIRKARKAAKLTQAELASRVGKPQSFISKLENGTLAAPAFADVLNIARALNVDPLALDLGHREVLA